MWSFLGRYRDFGLLVLRLGIGAMFVYHGAPKLLAGSDKWTSLGTALGHLGIHFMPMFWGLMAALSECLGGLCLALGLFFRPACLVMAVTMAVAANMHLALGDGLKTASHAIELGVVFFSLMFIGPGRFSLRKG